MAVKLYSLQVKSIVVINITRKQESTMYDSLYRNVLDGHFVN